MATLPAGTLELSTDGSGHDEGDFQQRRREAVRQVRPHHIPNGDKIKGVWICEKSAIAPPNYEIDDATLIVGPGVNSGQFSLVKPTNGWPVGTYRVDLYWNERVDETVKFTIE